SVTALPSVTLAPSSVPISRWNCTLSTALTCGSRCCNCCSCGHRLSETMTITAAPIAPNAAQAIRRFVFVFIFATKRTGSGSLPYKVARRIRTRHRDPSIYRPHYHAVKLAAWLDNHVHLLLTPPTTGAVARLMQKLGRSYVGQFNARHQRTGTLWEGRYKACLVDSESYVLRCQRYIDLNPVRARMTGNPAAYPWSSCAAHCGRRTDTLLTSHPAYAALGDTRDPRAAAYFQLLRQNLPDDDLAAIRTYLQQQRALGRRPFQTMVGIKTHRFAGIRPAHRPARSEERR